MYKLSARARFCGVSHTARGARSGPPAWPCACVRPLRDVHARGAQRPQTESPDTGQSARTPPHVRRGHLCDIHPRFLTPAREPERVLRRPVYSPKKNTCVPLMCAHPHIVIHTTYKPIYGQKVHHTQRDDRGTGYSTHTAVNNHGPRTEHILSPALPRRIHNMGYGTAFARGPPSGRSSSK